MRDQQTLWALALASLWRGVVVLCSGLECGWQSGAPGNSFGPGLRPLQDHLSQLVKAGALTPFSGPYRLGNVQLE